jgi:hypothetical protein
MGALFFDLPMIVIYMDDTIVFGYANFGTKPNQCPRSIENVTMHWHASIPR